MIVFIIIIVVVSSSASSGTAVSESHRDSTNLRRDLFYCCRLANTEKLHYEGENRDRLENGSSDYGTDSLTTWSLDHVAPVQKQSSLSVHNFLSNLADKQTNRQTRIGLHYLLLRRIVVHVHQIHWRSPISTFQHVFCHRRTERRQRFPPLSFFVAAVGHSVNFFGVAYVVAFYY